MQTRHSNLWFLAVAALFLLPVAARAEPSPTEQQSLDRYKKGVTAYDLGKFDEAVEEFQKAYELKPTPAYLYNIAQAYRQKGDAAKAVFFYRRYLQKAPDAPNRATVEKRIGELEELARKQEESKAKPPNSLEGEKDQPAKPEPPIKPEPTPPAVVEPPAVSPQPAPEETTVTQVSTPKRTVARLAADAGPAFVSLGSGPSVPTQMSLRLGAAYTLHLGSLELDLGLAGTLTPLPFETLDRQSSGTAMLIGALANVTARFALAGSLAGHGEVGGGMIFFSGLAAGNPFTDAGGEEGMLAMPHVRVAAGLDYGLGGGLVVTLTPAFSYTVPGDALDARIDSITRFDVLLGLAYAL